MRIGLIVRTVATEFVASIPDLPEASAEGRDLDELYRRAREAILSALEARAERGAGPPRRNLGLVELAALADEGGKSAVGVLFVDVD